MVGIGELRLLRPGEVCGWWNPAAVPAQPLLIVAPGATPAELQRLAGGPAAHAPAPWDTS